ncbi:MAG: type II toxin-antitoxin system VapC family toxin [Desulfamplus sp.]|nr:type II toxin-antitoxin system VapC family toxin [Desulfamplus sp.]
MRKALIDTNIISAFMRGEESVVEKVKAYLNIHDTLTISVITYYEIMRGIKALSNFKKIKAFNEFMSDCNIEEIDSLIAEKAADIYDELRIAGKLVEDADILIAATAMINEMVVVTDNTKHFERIKGLKCENWLEIN